MNFVTRASAMKGIRINVFTFILLLGLVGCMSPQQVRDLRIERESEVFSSFSLEIQAEVRLGHVEVGFTEDMVRLALGTPGYVYTRKTDEGVNRVWTYVDTEMDTGPPDKVPVLLIGIGYYGSVLIRSRVIREYIATRVEFKDGKVVAFERLKQ